MAQFREAIAYVEDSIQQYKNVKQDGDFLSAYDHKQFEMDIIALKALKIADYLKSGEVSKDMEWVGYVSMCNKHLPDTGIKTFGIQDAVAAYKAMSAKMLEEIEGEK